MLSYSRSSSTLFTSSRNARPIHTIQLQSASFVVAKLARPKHFSGDWNQNLTRIGPAMPSPAWPCMAHEKWTKPRSRGHSPGKEPAMARIRSMLEIGPKHSLIHAALAVRQRWYGRVPPVPPWEVASFLFTQPADGACCHSASKHWRLGALVLVCFGSMKCSHK